MKFSSCVIASRLNSEVNTIVCMVLSEENHYKSCIAIHILKCSNLIRTLYNWLLICCKLTQHYTTGY